MELRFAEDDIKELDTKRKKALKEYIRLQPLFCEMAKGWVARHFMISYLNEEIDIDNMSDEQMKRLDQCKDAETREHVSKDMPKHDVPYNVFYITPYGIGDEINRKDVTVDGLDTYVIETINERIQTRLDLYTNIK